MSPMEKVELMMETATWKSVDKFVKSKKINKYKVKGQSESRSSIIKYTSVGWEEYMTKALNKLKGI